MRRLLLALLISLVATPAFAATAGGNSEFSGWWGGANRWVGNITVFRAGTQTTVPLVRTNQGANDVPADGASHDVRLEVWPQTVGYWCGYYYSTDGWATSQLVNTTWSGAIGNNESFTATLPAAAGGQRLEYYVKCAINGEDLYIPGNSVNFYMDVKAAPTIAITAPANGASLECGIAGEGCSELVVSVEETDATAVTASIDGGEAIDCVDGGAAWTCTFTNVTQAAHTISATATGAVAQTASASLSVTITGAPPPQQIPMAGGPALGALGLAIAAAGAFALRKRF